MTRIVNFLPHKFYNGGIEAYLANACVAMKELGDQFVLLRVGRDKTVYDEIFEESGVDVEYISEKEENKISIFKLLYKYVREHPEDLIHLHGAGASLLQFVIAAKLGRGYGVICHIHSIYTGKNPLGLRKRIRDNAFSFLFGWLPDIRIAVSSTAGKTVFLKRDFFMVHNGIIPERFRFNAQNREYVRNALGANDKFIIGQIGRLVPHKNYIFSLEIIKRYRRIRSNIIFVIIGEGEDKEIINDYILHNDLDDVVVVLEPNNRIEDYYSAFDLLLFPSLFEALGMVAVEAQCSGLPVICSESIVREVYFTDFIYSCDCNKTDVWLSRIDNVYSEKIDRISASEKGIISCNDAGFTISGIRKDLQKVYMKKGLDILTLRGE